MTIYYFTEVQGFNSLRQAEKLKATNLSDAKKKADNESSL